MPDLRDQLHRLDEVDVPDLLSEAYDLGPQTPMSFGPSRAKRAVIILVAITIAALPFVGFLALERSAPPAPVAPPGPCAWNTTPYELPPMSGGPSLVTGTATDDLWIGGPTSPHVPPELFHLQGSTWSAVEHPASQILGMRALALDDLWLLTNDGTLRFDGTTWTKQRFPSAPAMQVTAFDVRSSTDAWAVGSSARDGYPVILHWNGNAWSWSYRGDRNTMLGRAPSELNGVSAWTPNDVWVVGDASPGSDRSADLLPTAMHWDGSVWRTVPMENHAPSEAPRDTTSAVAAIGADAAIVSTSRGMLRYDEGTWERQPFPLSAASWELQRGATDAWGLLVSMNGNALARWSGDGFEVRAISALAQDDGEGEPWGYGFAPIGDDVVVVGSGFQAGDQPPFAILVGCM